MPRSQRALKAAGDKAFQQLLENIGIEVVQVHSSSGCISKDLNLPCHNKKCKVCYGGARSVHT